MFVVAVLAAFTGVSTEARAMLVYSYYSDQIIITTDERWSGPVDLPPEVGPSIAACWRAPHQGDQITVQLSFKRDGSIFGKPRVNYVKPMNGSTAQALTVIGFQFQLSVASDVVEVFAHGFEVVAVARQHLYDCFWGSLDGPPYLLYLRLGELSSGLAGASATVGDQIEKWLPLSNPKCPLGHVPPPS